MIRVAVGVVVAATAALCGATGHRRDRLHVPHGAVRVPAARLAVGHLAARRRHVRVGIGRRRRQAHRVVDVEALARLRSDHLRARARLRFA